MLDCFCFPSEFLKPPTEFLIAKDCCNRALFEDALQGLLHLPRLSDDSCLPGKADYPGHLLFCSKSKIANRMPKGVWFLKQQELKDLQVLKNTQTYFGKTNKCMYMRTGDVIFLF